LKCRSEFNIETARLNRHQAIEFEKQNQFSPTAKGAGIYRPDPFTRSENGLPLLFVERRL
jgi:hypothetical protein